jgi:tetratricopeptide (TPR) repeat protein
MTPSHSSRNQQVPDCRVALAACPPVSYARGYMENTGGQAASATLNTFCCERTLGTWRHSIVVTCVTCVSLVCGCAESPESPEVLVARGHLMESRGKLDDAVDAYTRALARRPDDATIYYDRGVALGRQGHWDDAIADYSQAIEHDPGMAKAYNNRATAHAQGHRFDAAVADFTKAISLDSKSALAYRNRGLAYHDLGQIAPSIEDYTVAIRLDPNDFESRFERGNVYLDAGEYQKAIVDYDQAIALDAKQASAWLNRGEAHRRLGHTKESQADLAEARRLAPNQKPTELAHATPEKALLPPPPASTSEVDRRHERAVAVAREFLRSRGYEIEKSPAADMFPLVGRKGNQRILVRVQSPADGEPLRFTRDDLDQMAGRGDPTALVVVGNLAPPAAPGQPYTRGAVIKFVENWKAVRDKLVPVVFEFPLR